VADELHVMGEAAEYFWVAVANHDCPQHSAQDEKSERLQTVEITQKPSE
jgi:hypothetical protein